MMCAMRCVYDDGNVGGDDDDDDDSVLHADSLYESNYSNMTNYSDDERIFIRTHHHHHHHPHTYIHTIDCHHHHRHRRRHRCHTHSAYDRPVCIDFSSICRVSVSPLDPHSTTSSSSHRPSSSSWMAQAAVHTRTPLVVSRPLAIVNWR